MCVAAIIKPGGNIDDGDVHRLFSANRDGAGLAYVKTTNGKAEVVIKKGFFDSTAWLMGLRAAQKDMDVDSPILMHARIATQGKVNEDNCHPFKIKDGALIHNGSFWHGGHRGHEKSDTREFAERMHNNFDFDDIMFDKKNVQEAISHNKVVLLFKDKRYIILNEGHGKWHGGGFWTSNCNWTWCQPKHCEGMRS